jgi:hypothetical protein
MRYIIDSNILITAHRISHPMDIHPSFWSELKDIFQREDVISIIKVKKELEYFEDDLKNWIKGNIESSFWKKSDLAISQYALIQNWVNKQHYNSTAKANFAEANNADPFLIAYSLFLKEEKNIDSSIVTLEVSAPYSKKSIKIPDVCHAFGLRSIDNNDFFREINVVF